MVYMALTKTMTRLPDVPTPQRRANRSKKYRTPRRDAEIAGRIHERVEVFEILPAQDIIRVSIETITHPRQPERVIAF